MNEILFVMDSVGWNEFKDANTPYLDKFRPKKAYSFSMYTCPSVHAMMLGSVPVPEGERGYRPYSIYAKSEHAHIPATLRFKKDYGTILVSNNVLIRDSFSGFDDEIITIGSDYDTNTIFSCELLNFCKEPIALELVRDFADIIRKYDYNPFYSFMIFTETHTPYIGKDNKRETQLKAIEYLDLVFHKLYKSVPKNTRIIVTADHSDCWVNGKLYGHNPRRYGTFIQKKFLMNLLEVFLVEVIKC
jgi:hypothetical protein